MTVSEDLTARSMRNVRNHLRTHRRQWHLTQEELAFIFGYSDQSTIARFEREERAIPLRVAHACRLLFGLEPREMFPALFESVEKGATNRIHELRERLLQNKPTQRTLAKLELLQEALGRIAALSEQEV